MIHILRLSITEVSQLLPFFKATIVVCVLNILVRFCACPHLIHHNTIDATGRFLDLSLVGVAGEDVWICVKIEDATGNIERPVNFVVNDLNGTAFRKFFRCKTTDCF